MFSWLRAVWNWIRGLFGWSPPPTRTVEDFAPPGSFQVVDRLPDGSVITRFGPSPDVRLAKRAFYKPISPGVVREFHDGATLRGRRVPE